MPWEQDTRSLAVDGCSEAGPFWPLSGALTNAPSTVCRDMLPRTRSASSFLLFVVACACGSSAENNNADPNAPDSSATGGSAGSSGIGGSSGTDAGTDAGGASAGAAGAAGSAADASCGDTTSDPKNCGNCGHTCLGGTCESSHCTSVTIATLSPSEQPTYIVSNGADIFFHSSLGVRRVAKDGLSQPATLSSSVTGGLRGLDRGGPWIYSADSTGSVYRTPTTGGAIEVLWSGSGTPETLTALGSYVYFADPKTDSIRRVIQTGGAVETVTTVLGQNAYALASQGQVLYWARLNGMLAKLDLSQPTPSPAKFGDLLKTSSALHVAIAASATRVYWSFEGSASDSPVASSVAIGGGDQQPLTADPVWGLTTDNTYVYWSRSGPSGSITRRVQTNATAQEELVGSLTETRGIAVDPDAVYFAQYDPATSQGWIKKVAEIAARATTSI